VELYKKIVHGECIVTDCRTAELAKLTENSFRDINIAFANELSIICDKLGIDVWELISLANRHPRVNILQPGPGVGGHCIAVDPWFIISRAPEEARLIRTARETNDYKPAWVLSKIDAAVKEAAEKGKERATIACFGLAFKANIDDLRESPAVEITKRLAARYPGQLLVVEPHIAALPASLAGLARKCSLAEALATADILVMLVDHNEFRKVSGADLANKTCIDTRGIWTMRPSSGDGRA
jgi:UDP-N-acetyl-D-mannosaminuronic acid dehydrogenase